MQEAEYMRQIENPSKVSDSCSNNQFSEIDDDEEYISDANHQDSDNQSVELAAKWSNIHT